MPSARFPLADGWDLHVNNTPAEAWLGVTGPLGQLAAFECGSETVRYEVLNQLLVDLIAAASVPKSTGEQK